MKDFILIELVDGNINDPIYYKDFSTALSELYVRMAKVCGYTESDIPLMISQAHELQPDLGLCEHWEECRCEGWVEDYDGNHHEFFIQHLVKG